MNISISSNIKQFVKVLQKEIAQQDKAFYSAIKKTAQQTETYAKKETRNQYNIKLKDLNKNIWITVRKQLDGEYVARIAANRDLPLIAFGAKKVPQGVSVTVKKGQQKIIKHAFIATMISGHKGVFQRYKGTVKSSKRKVAKNYVWDRTAGENFVPRLPIDELYSKGAGHIITQNIFRKIGLFVRTNFPRILQDKIRYFTQLKKS
ncbi:MAG TPA: hypothetical protein DCX45_03650 [Acinetobacter junii]|nr:hypothetical protein [Acinetobacter junii]